MSECDGCWSTTIAHQSCSTMSVDFISTTRHYPAPQAASLIRYISISHQPIHSADPRLVCSLWIVGEWTESEWFNRTTKWVFTNSFKSKSIIERDNYSPVNIPTVWVPPYLCFTCFPMISYHIFSIFSSHPCHLFKFFQLYFSNIYKGLSRDRTSKPRSLVDSGLGNGRWIGKLYNYYISRLVLNTYRICLLLLVGCSVL